MNTQEFFKKWTSTRPNLKTSFHDAGIEAMAFADAYYKHKIMATEKIERKAIRDYPPKTKFISIFGADDIVSDKDRFRFDKNGDIYVLGESNKMRLIYNGSYWALIKP